MLQYTLRTAYSQPVTDDEGNLTGEHTRIAELDCWQVYDHPDEIPDDHPGQHVVSRNGKHWLEPKRILMLRLDDLDRDYMYCCTGARISGHDLLEQKTTVYTLDDVEESEEEVVTETVDTYVNEWSEKKGRYIRRIKKEEVPVYDTYEVEDEKGNIIDTVVVERTREVKRVVKKEVAVEITLKEAIEDQLGETLDEWIKK